MIYLQIPQKWGSFREVAEWSKAHAWKVCISQKGIKGSNPFLSANFIILGLSKRFFINSSFFKQLFANLNLLNI